MQKNYSTFNIPSFARVEVYDFPETEDQLLFDELSKISEEILKCRQENSLI